MVISPASTVAKDMLLVDTWHHNEGDQGYELILDIMMRVTKVIWRCLVTVVLVTKVVYEWYLAIVVIIYMMLIKKIWKGIATNGRLRWHWLAIRVWIANGMNMVPLVPILLKLISRSRIIRWLMMLVIITNIGMVTPC